MRSLASFFAAILNPCKNHERSFAGFCRFFTFQKLAVSDLLRGIENCRKINLQTGCLHVQQLRFVFIGVFGRSAEI